MTSRERLLAAFRRQDVDHLPCSIYFNTNLRVPGYDLSRWPEHIRLQIDVGTDPVAYLALPNARDSRVSLRTWDEQVAGVGEVRYREYTTPAGTLRMGVRTTSVWPQPGELPWHDHTASNLHEPLIKGPEDVDAFAHLWAPPMEADLESVADSNAGILAAAREHGLPVEGYAGGGLATLLFTMGAERAIYLAVDHPEAFEHLARLDSETNIARIRLSALAGADYVKRFGGYEQTNLYSPEIFRRVVLPLLRGEVDAAHDAGVLIYYRVVTGMEPILGDIAGAGLDCIEGGEPRLSECSMEQWRDRIDGRACSWTGVSSPALLGGGTTDDVRAEVRRAVEVFGQRGFILGVTNSIRDHFRWENVLAMVDEWKRVRA